ncbi:phage protein NinX family protein [Cronobacter muytjensii]|uniref:phage protein NinX family protein n=1 Tax=Cronobacter muytjensii TaxID=413501 RepID=UPI0029FA8480|nr:protein ninX [Cronobacter muytjensii]
MDYSQLSDQEINLLVAKIQHPDKTFIESKTRSPSVVMLNHINMWIDYCNNPSDAWPIIVQNRIGLNFVNGNWRAQSLKTGWVEFCHENPLRAAMTVFLMMQESKHA